jgi:membrane fusion protein (multidrug efflux system)
LKVAEAKQRSALKSAELIRVTSGAGVDEASSGVSRARSGVETARAQLEAARSRVDQAAAQRVTMEAVAEQVQAEVVSAETEAARADVDWKRYQDASQSRGVSRQQLDLAAASAKSARARLEAARKKSAAAQAQIAESRAAERTAAQNLNQADAQLGEAVARVGEARGRLSGANGAPHQVAASRSQAEAAAAEAELARASLRRAELDLSYTKVFAPEGGRVTRKGVEAGAFIQAGQGLLALVSPELWVVANFKETQVKRMRSGQPAFVHIDAYPSHSFKAHVQSLQSGAGARFSVLPPENATGNFVKVVQRVPVKIVFDDELPAELNLGPGMSVEPEVRVR